jgi:hypothetical protein
VVVPRTAHAGSRRYSPSSLVWCGRARARPPRPLAPARPSPRRGLPAVPSRPIGPVPAAAPWSDTDAPEVYPRCEEPRTPLTATRGGAPAAARAAAAEDVLELVSSAGRSSVVLPRVPTSDLRPGVLLLRSLQRRSSATAARGGRPTRRAARTASTGSGSGRRGPAPRARAAARASRLAATVHRAAPRRATVDETRFAYSRSDSLASSVGFPSMIRETLCFYSARVKNTLAVSGLCLKESTTTETLSIAPSVRTRVM